MIFLTVGTWRRGFDRLVQAVDELAGSGVIADRVVAQIGYGSYQPKHLDVIDFCTPEKFEELVSSAGVIISHAGMGTIIQAVKQSKPIVVVPRRRALGEVSNNHQFNTARQLETEGKVLVAYEVSDLPAKLRQAGTFVPTADHCSERILHEVQEFLDEAVLAKRLRLLRKSCGFLSRFWPYRILRRDDDDIKADLGSIMQHFERNGVTFDTVVFIPNAGSYLSRLFIEMYSNSFTVHSVTIRRASTAAKGGVLAGFVFKRKWLSNVMRHLEVLIRLAKYKLKIPQEMVGGLGIDFDVTNKRVLVIDDSVDTGTTMRLVKSALLEKGAQSVTTACISNHLVPDKVRADYSVYYYKLLRTKNSRDYYAA